MYRLQFLKSIPRGGLDGVQVAAFDARFSPEQIDEVGILAFFVRLFGYAAETIEKRLQRAGGEPAVSPGWFYISEMCPNGPGWPR